MDCLFLVVVLVLFAIVLALTMFRTGTTLTAVTTFATLGTGTTLTLYIALGLLEQYATAELELARLLVDVDELDLDLVAFLQTAFFNGLQTLPVDFRNVQQTILAQNNIKSIECVEYPELGMEAIWKIEVEDFPAFILVDDKGNDFFKQLKPCQGCSILK